MAAKSKKATYHSPDGTTPVYDILKENSDGTVDLGTDEVLVIGKCIVAEVPTIGQCTLGGTAPEDEKKAEAPEEKETAPEEKNEKEDRHGRHK